MYSKRMTAREPRYAVERLMAWRIISAWLDMPCRSVVAKGSKPPLGSLLGNRQLNEHRIRQRV